MASKPTNVQEQMDEEKRTRVDEKMKSHKIRGGQREDGASKKRRWRQ